VKGGGEKRSRRDGMEMLQGGGGLMMERAGKRGSPFHGGKS
jgi:hypothetical protein